MENIDENRELLPRDFEGTPYSLLELMGSGSFGRVYKAEERASGRMVAVKVPKQYTIEDKNEGRFLQRIRRKGDPDEVNIIRLLDQIVVRGVPSLVLEFLPMSLLVFLKSKGPLALSQVRCLGIQLFKAISFLKDLEIVHSDIKPGNIMVASWEDSLVRVKLIDLGGFEVTEAKPAKIWRELTTRCYRAPEVVMGLPASFPIDVWGVTLVLIEAFTMKMVFPAQSNKDLVTYFSLVFGELPRDLFEGEFVIKFFDKVAEGIFTRKMSQSQKPELSSCLRYGCENLIAKAQKKSDAYRQDIASFVEFIKRGLCLSPAERILAEEALEEESFFTLDDFQCDGSDHEKEALRLKDLLLLQDLHD